jgi:hypothetical protein
MLAERRFNSYDELDESDFQKLSDDFESGVKTTFDGDKTKQEYRVDFGKKVKTIPKVKGTRAIFSLSVSPVSNSLDPH